MFDSDNIELWCWVQGDKSAQVFPVSIKRSANIQYLKKAIQKQKSSFKDITASALDLYKVGQVVHITAGIRY
jgi:crinkler effector protein